MKTTLEEGKAVDRETCQEAFVLTERNDEHSDHTEDFLRSSN